jgi:hypothetical protein
MRLAISTVWHARGMTGGGYGIRDWAWPLVVSGAVVLMIREPAAPAPRSSWAKPKIKARNYAVPKRLPLED